jgi:hypothetical protein
MTLPTAANSEIAIGNKDGKQIGQLRRAREGDADNAQLVSDLTSWRNANGRFFLTRFEATEPRTALWLRQTVLPDPARAFFLIEGLDGQRLGHLGVLGLDSQVPELDNMIRGRNGGDPQIMHWAEVALIGWVFDNTPANKMSLSVFSNNWIPISIHQSIGFVNVEIKPLYRRTEATGVSLSTQPDAGEKEKFGYLRMELQRTAFEAFRSQKCHPSS